VAWRWLRTIRRRVREHVDLALECAALRHQVAILQKSRPRHLRIGPWDRLLWAFLSRYWRGWREALVLVQAETVLRWGRQRGGLKRLIGSRRRRRGGRPRIDAEIRDLISRMARNNVLWGAPRIHGELLMLGFKVSQATVSRYLRKCVRPASPGWRAFIRTQFFLNGVNAETSEVFDHSGSIAGQHHTAPLYATANRVTLRRWVRDRRATKRSARGSGDRCAASCGRANVQVHSLTERYTLRLWTDVATFGLPDGIGLSQPRAPPLRRTPNARMRF
jgi:hypothetical protein